MPSTEASYLFIDRPSSAAVKPMPCHPATVEDRLPDFPDDKEAKGGYRRWTEENDDCHLLVAAGSDPWKKISAENQAAEVRAFVADYDGEAGVRLSDDEVVARARDAAGRDDLKPTWLYRTWCGKPRLVWEFPEPVAVSNSAMARALMERLAEKLRPDATGLGLDPASLRPGQPFHRGRPGSWVRTGEALPQGVVMEAFFKAGTAARAPAQYRIPFEAARDEIRRRWPNLPDPEVGQMCYTWWFADPHPEKDRACQILEEGVQVYSSRGAGFHPWVSILGREWSDKYRESQAEALATRCWFHEASNSYYHDLPGTGSIMRRTKEDLMADLVIYAHISPKTEKGEDASPLSKAVADIRVRGTVDVVAPVHYDQRSVVVTPEGARVLNTTRWKKPGTMPGATGVRSDHGFLDDYFHNFTDPVPDPETGIMPSDALIYGTQRFYRMALDGTWGKTLGHAILFSGPVGRGKSFFFSKILPALMGGGLAQDAYRFLCGQTQFNGALASAIVWYVDDQEPPSHPEAREKFAARLKQAVATPQMRTERKGMEAGETIWGGRIVFAMNDDPRSIRAIPEIDGSLRDKICLFRVNPAWSHRWDDFAATEERMRREMPSFARWLLDWEPPEAVRAHMDNRFGFQAYHHPDLLAVSESLSTDSGLYEVLGAWVRSPAADIERENGPVWRGTALELARLLSATDGGDYIRRNYEKKGALSFALQKQAEKVLKGLVHQRESGTKKAVLWEVDLDPAKWPKP